MIQYKHRSECFWLTLASWLTLSIWCVKSCELSIDSILSINPCFLGPLIFDRLDDQTACERVDARAELFSCNRWRQNFQTRKLMKFQRSCPVTLPMSSQLLKSFQTASLLQLTWLGWGAVKLAGVIPARSVWYCGLWFVSCDLGGLSGSVWFTDFYLSAWWGSTFDSSACGCDVWHSEFAFERNYQVQRFFWGTTCLIPPGTARFKDQVGKSASSVCKEIVSAAQILVVNSPHWIGVLLMEAILRDFACQEQRERKEEELRRKRDEVWCFQNSLVDRSADLLIRDYGKYMEVHW